MSKMRKEIPTKLPGESANRLSISSAKEKKRKRFISNISVHGIAWWILYRFHQSTRQLNIW